MSGLAAVIPARLFVFLIVEHSRKRTHAHVYSVDAEQSHPPYRHSLIESNRAERNQIKRNSKYERIKKTKEE